MKNIYTQQNDDVRALEDELKRRLTEIEALRAAREQDRFMIQKVDYMLLYIKKYFFPISLF